MTCLSFCFRFFSFFYIYIFFSWRVGKIQWRPNRDQGGLRAKPAWVKMAASTSAFGAAFIRWFWMNWTITSKEKLLWTYPLFHSCRYDSWYVVGSVPLFESWQIGVWGDDDVKIVRSRSPVSRKCSRASSARSASGRGVSGLNRCTVTSFLFCFLFPFFTCTSPHQLVQRHHPLKGWMWRLDVKGWMWRRRFHLNFRRVHFG